MNKETKKLLNEIAILHSEIGAINRLLPILKQNTVVFLRNTIAQPANSLAITQNGLMIAYKLERIALKYRQIESLELDDFDKLEWRSNDSEDSAEVSTNEAAHYYESQINAEDYEREQVLNNFYK